MGKFLDSVKNKKVDSNKNTTTAQKKVGKFGKSVMESKIGLDTIDADLQALGTTVESIYKEWQPQETITNTKATIASMQERLNAYQEYAKLFGGNDVAELASGYKTVLEDLDNRAATYGKFKIAEDYTKAVERKKSLPTADLNAVSTEVADLDKQIAEIKAQKERFDNEYKASGGYIPSGSNYNRPGANQVEPYKEWQTKSSEYEQQIKDLENKKADRQAFYEDAKSTQETLATVQKETELASDPKNMDGFNQYIANYDAAMAEKAETPWWVTAIGNIGGSGSDASDTINQIVREKREDKSWQLPKGDWTDDEKRVLGGYFLTDPQAAIDYVVRKNNEKAKGEQAKTETKIQDSATSNFWAGAGHTLGSVATAPLGLADYLDDVTDKIAGRPIIEEKEVTPFEYSQAVTSGISTHLNDMSGTLNENIPVIGGKGLGDAYGLGQSVLQSAASAYTLGGVGTLISYFGQGAAAGVDDALARGATDEEALAYGLVLGAAEGVSEMIGADKLLKLGSPNEIRKILVNGFKKGGGKAFWSLVDRQGKAEAIEELFSGVAGKVADNFILKGKSNFDALTREYRSLGMSASDAAKKAWMESIGEVAYDALGGYLSGAFHAGPQVAVSAVKQNTENKTIGQEIRGNNRVTDMLNIASLSPQESDAYEAYTQYAKQGVNAENITDAQLGNLYGMAEADAVSTVLSKNSADEKKADAETTYNRLTKMKTENKAAKVEQGLSQTTEEGTVTPATREMVVNEQTKGMSEAEANLFRLVDDGKSNVVDYADSFNLVVAMAQNDYDQDYILEHRGVLSTAQVSSIYQSVVTNPKMAQQKRLEALIQEQGDNLEIKGTIDDSVIDYGNTGAKGKVNWKDLHPNVKATVAYISGFATKVAGMDVQLVTNGREYGFTGQYDRRGNTMLVDITALTERVKSADTKGRKDNARFVISTVAHEVTHWMEEKAPELYAQYDKMVMDALTSNGRTEAEVLGRRRALLERAEAKRAAKENRKPREITDKEVRREVIARASEDMLALSEEGKKFFESMTESEQKTFVGKIKEVIRNIKDWIKSVLSNLKSDAPEAVELRALAKDLDAISKKWDEMLRQAAKANAAMKKAGVTDGDITPEIGDIAYSMIHNEDIKEKSVKYYNAHKASHISDDMLDAANEIIDEMVGYMLPYLDIKNNNGRRYLPEEILGRTIFKNGSYGKTIENTTICYRTLAYIDFTNEIKKKIGRPLTVEESFLASQMLYDIAKDPQCLYCYVSLDRKAYDGFLLEYIKQMKSVIDGYDALETKSKNAISNLYKAFLAGRADTKPMKARFDMWIDLAKNGGQILSESNLVTEEERAAIKAKGGVLAKQVADAERYAQTASWAKKLEQYRSYNSEILNMSSGMVSRLNAHYGLRFYSFSEYTAAFIVENMQQIRDAALKGLHGLGYTKEVDFAKIFAPTGMNINISVFGRMVDGKVVPDTRQGADWDDVKDIRKQYKNVGAVFVATNDELVEWALAQDWIDVVIPFHIVRTGANIAEFYKWVNNTKFQNDVDAKGKNKTISPAEHHNDFVLYKKLIKARGLTPRFERWIDNPNYMKLVNETRLSFTESSKLIPKFNLEDAKQSFDKFIEEGGYYGDWYNEGVDYNAAVDTVANDVLAGKRANEVSYGRQDINVAEAMKRNKPRVHNGGVQYADIDTTIGKKPWRTGFSNTEFAELMRIAKHELGKSTGYIDNDNKWLYNNKNGRTYFAIYSTAHVDNPTILYASKGKKAQNENRWFGDFIAEVEKEGNNGRHDLRGEVINEVLTSFGYALGQSGVYSRVNAKQRGNNGNVRLYSQSSGIRPSAALLTVLENIAKIQERESGVTQYSDIDSDLGDMSVNDLFHDIAHISLEIEKIERDIRLNPYDNEQREKRLFDAKERYVKYGEYLLANHEKFSLKELHYLGRSLFITDGFSMPQNFTLEQFTKDLKARVDEYNESLNVRFESDMSYDDQKLYMFLKMMAYREGERNGENEQEGIETREDDWLVEAGNDFPFSDIDAEVDIYEVLGENKRLAKENKKLREDFDRLMERLKLERQLTHGNRFNENQLDAVAGHIRNIANSTYSKPELVKKLREVYTYLATSKEVTWDDLFARLYGIAEDVLRESKTTMVNDYYANIYKDLRNTEISLSEEQKRYVKSMLGVDWHRAFFGKIKVSDNGIPLNSKWEEWAGKYPSEFTETNDLNQVLELLDIYETAKELKEVVEEYNDVEQARWLANELYNQYWNVSTIRTTADKYDQQIKRLNFAHRQAMQELRGSYQERLAQQKKSDKEKRSEIFKKIREKHKEELQEVRAKGKERMDKYKEEAARKTRIHSITANSLTLNEWLIKNSKDKHIHESMKGPVIALLNAIDFSSKRALGMWGGDLSGMPTDKDISLQKALSQVQKMMADASVGKEDLVLLYGHELDADIADMIESVDNIMRTVGDNEFILNKMTLDDLITLDNVVKTIKHAVTQMNKFHAVHHAKGIANLAQEEIIYAEKLGKAKVYNGKSFKAGVRKLLAWKNINPYYAFKRFGAAGKKIFEAFQDGYDKFAFNIKEIIDFTNNTYGSKEVQEWENEIKSFELRVPATESEISNPGYKPQYQKIQMTVAQIMDLYLLNKREAARVHLLGGGIRVADIETKGSEVISQAEGVVLEQQEIDEIIKTLTPRQIEVADALSHFMNTTSSDWGNEVSMARFGYRAFGEKNYVPMQVDKNNLAVDDETEKNNSLFRLLNMSFTKSLTENANNRLVVSSIFDVFAQHTSDMAKYNALALPVLDAFRWYNYKEKGFKGDTAFVTKSVKQAIENAFGKDGQSYITTFLKDLNGQENTSRDTIGRGFFTKAKVAAVGANLRVALLQPTAYLKASANIDNKYLVKALMHKPKIGRAEKYCGMALWKSMGYFDTNVQRGVADQIKHAETKYDKAVELSMKGAEWGDKVTFGYLWNAAELEIREKRQDLKVGSDEFYYEVGKRLRDIIYSTQVVDSVMTRSEMMRSPDWGDKLITTFASEPTIAYSMLADAYFQTQLDARELGSKKEAIKKNAKYMARVFTAYTVTNLVAALVESGFDVLRDDDDEEMDMAEFMKLYLENFATNQSITAKIPWLKEAVSILQGFTSTRMDTQWIQTFSNTLKQVAKLMQGEGNPAKLIKNGLQTTSYAFGLPFYNAYRDLMAVLNKLDILTAEELDELLKDFN